MKTLVKTLALFLFTLFTIKADAQKNGRDFKDIDAAVIKLGRLDSMNIGSIANLLTKNLTDKTDKARAIFTWITHNIGFDLKNARNNDPEKNTAVLALLNRKTTGQGYASLFQDMCSSAGLRCLTVEGFIKYGPEQIGDTKTEKNHTWNVLQLGQSPEAWYYVDACRGSGYPDEDFKTFTKEFNPDYFFADLTIFNWEHYPDNTAWYLGPRVKNKKDFFDLPVLLPAVYPMGVKRFLPESGKVKVKVNKPLYFSYQISLDADVSKVQLVFGEGKKKKVKDVDHKLTGKNLSFSYTFEEEDNLTVTVMVNGKALMMYAVEIE